MFTDGAIGGGIDFTSDPLTAIFTPGASQATVELNITKDGLFEETEMLKFNLTVPDEFSNINGMLLIKTGDNDMADGEIINSGGVYIIVNSVVFFFVFFFNILFNSYVFCFFSISQFHC